MSASFIMLVDDEIPFVETMEKRLKKRKYDVITANDGQEALNTLETNKNLDVIILDVKMPGLDGIETLKILRGNEEIKVKTSFPLKDQTDSSLGYFFNMDISQKKHYIKVCNYSRKMIVFSG